MKCRDIQPGDFIHAVTATTSALVIGRSQIMAMPTKALTNRDVCLEVCDLYLLEQFKDGSIEFHVVMMLANFDFTVSRP